MQPGDLPGVVRVHQYAFDGFFLDQMGGSFLRQYYATVLSYGASLSLVAVDPSDEVIGIAVGFLDPRAFYAHFRRCRLHFVPAIVLALLRRPGLLRGILTNTRRLATGGALGADVAELASLGVRASGSGVGSRLLARFCEEMFSTGASRIVLTTDDDANGSVQSFYERRGFRHVGQEVRGVRVLRQYELKAPERG